MQEGARQECRRSLYTALPHSSAIVKAAKASLIIIIIIIIII
jgi:hypothetical protein